MHIRAYVEHDLPRLIDGGPGCGEAAERDFDHGSAFRVEPPLQPEAAVRPLPEVQLASRQWGGLGRFETVRVEGGEDAIADPGQGGRAEVAGMAGEVGLRAAAHVRVDRVRDPVEGVVITLTWDGPITPAMAAAAVSGSGAGKTSPVIVRRGASRSASRNRCRASEALIRSRAESIFGALT